MKRLIVNADDLAADEARNAGIFQAIEAGVVTSVSILPNGPALKNALLRIGSLPLARVSLGIHFNLSEGMPVASGHKILTNPDGCFRGKQATQKLLTSRGNSRLESEIRNELEAQVEVFHRAKIRIDHLDGHQHVHVLPASVRAVAEGATRYGIPWVRVPEEYPNEFRTGPLPPGLLEEAGFFAGFAEAARPLLEATGVLSTNHFRGLYFKGRLPASRWAEFLDALPAGLSELMVHPGFPAAPDEAGPFSHFSTPDRLADLEALVDGRFESALLKTGVELTSFPEASI